MEDQQRSRNNLDEMEIEKLHLETIHLTNTSRFFPELVWDQVVNNLTSTNDIESCANSSSYFRKLLAKKRETQVLIPNVFPILLHYLIEDKYVEAIDIEDEVADLQGELPDIEDAIRYLDFQDVGNNANHEIDIENLDEGEDMEDEQDFENDNQEEIDNSMNAVWNCRLVSKSWNSAIDSLFPHKEAGHCILRFDMSSFKYLELDPWCNERFMPSWPPQYFMEHFDPTHYNFEENKPIKNPFLGRSVQFMHVQIYRQQQNEYILYLNGILEFLQKYGSKIWYVFFDFCINIFLDDPVVMYQRLQQYLTLLPNLKVLRVDYRDIHPPTHEILHHEPMRNYVFGMLDEEVNRNPMPTLPKLEFMCLSNLPTPIFNQLIFKNRHITQLQLDRKAYHGDYGMFWVHLPNLTALNMKMASVDQFETLKNCWFPMQLEKVYLWYDGTNPFLSWSKIFDALESKFGDSCEELLIQMPAPKTEEEKKQVLEESHICRLNLKKLKRITFFDDTPFCLDFLLPSRNTLEDILLRYSNDKNEKAVAQHLANQQVVGCRQIVQFVGFKEKMEESNIWTEFPKLTDLTLHRSEEMGYSVSYTVLNKENQGGGMGVQCVNIRLWSRETRQNID